MIYRYMLIKFGFYKDFDAQIDIRSSIISTEGGRHAICVISR
jgi:hypothetical protein